MIKLELLKVRARYQSGAHNEIQTHDLFLRRETLYSAELYGHDRRLLKTSNHFSFKFVAFMAIPMTNT